MSKIKVKPPKAIKLLEKELQELFHDGNISLGEIDQYSGHYCIVRGRGVEIYFDKDLNHQIGLLPLKLETGDEYLLSISITVNTSTMTIKSIAVSFYTYEKDKLFRAEWGKNESNIKHAQPHWHIHYNSPTLRTWIDEGEFDQDEEINIYTKFHKIHFAMFASWHVDNEHVIDLTGNHKSIINWILEVIKYVKIQLIYLKNKSLIK